MHGARMDRRRGEVGKSGACWCCPAANSSIGISGKIPVPDCRPTASACFSRCDAGRASLGCWGGFVRSSSQAYRVHGEHIRCWCERRSKERRQVVDVHEASGPGVLGWLKGYQMPSGKSGDLPDLLRTGTHWPP